MIIAQHAGGLMYYLDGTPMWAKTLEVSALNTDIFRFYGRTIPRLLKNIKRK